jgi:hypothetical protein
LNQKEGAWSAKTNVVNLEELRGQTLGQILLYAGLLSSQELSHRRK